MDHNRNGKTKRLLLCLLAAAALLAVCSGCGMDDKLLQAAAKKYGASFFSTMTYEDGTMLCPPLKPGMTYEEVLSSLQPDTYTTYETKTTIKINGPEHYSEFADYDAEKLLLFSDELLYSVCYHIPLWDADFKDAIKMGKRMFEDYKRFCEEKGGVYSTNERYLPIEDFVDDPTLYQNSLNVWRFDNCKLVFRLIHMPLEGNDEHPDAKRVVYMEIRVDY